MAIVVYTLCALTALLCAVLLLRGYARTRSKVLWWSGLCFTGLMISNIGLVLDKLVFSASDFSVWRLWITMIALLMLLYGLIYDHD